MITRIEIDGFKSFERFALDLQPFTAIVGPNASGKSNLFDAIHFLARLSQTDIRNAMNELRGEPEELFRTTSSGTCTRMAFAIEVLLEPEGRDAFGTNFKIASSRVRYELMISLRRSSTGQLVGIFVTGEDCRPILKKDDRSTFARSRRRTRYSARSAFIETIRGGPDRGDSIVIRQDGPRKRGRPVALPLADASRTALSTVASAEFPHLYALKDLLASVRFLQIDPQSSRRPSDRLAPRQLAPDASNLATVLAKLRDETRTEIRPLGALADIAADLASLIPSVGGIELVDDPSAREYSFKVNLYDDLTFSSRVISDGTLRLLALLTVLNDPTRRGTLCFEEPENGVHEGRIEQLVDLLRSATAEGDGSHLFQVIVNTHSPAVMKALLNIEVVAADTVSTVDPASGRRTSHTRMRVVPPQPDLFNPAVSLSISELESMLKRRGEAA